MQRPRATLLRRMCLLATTLALAGTLRAQVPPAAAYVVIVHPSNQVTSLPRREVANLFMKRKAEWTEGTAVHPLDQPASSPVRISFSQSVLGREADAVVSFWYQQVFSGRGVQPLQLPNDAAVVSAVRADPAAIGYVSPPSVTPEVKVLTVTP
jgi:ABC-type phosphate transport system substrate-binding protein